MASFVSGLLLKRVIRVRVEGSINQKMTDKILSGLNTSPLIKPEGVVVTINSAGGSLTQAKNIADILRNYSARNNTSIYCFAEDQCLGSANLILTVGVKAYSNSMTLMGDIGFTWSRMWFKKFGEKYDIKQEFVSAGENKIKFNPFEDMKPQSQKWMQNYLYLLEHDLKVAIINNRETHFRKLNMDQNAIDQQLFSLGIVPAETAVKMGLIDGIRNLDDILDERFYDTKVKEVNKPHKFDKFNKAAGSLGMMF